MLTECGKAILLLMTVANGASPQTSLIADRVMTVSNSLLKKEKDATVNVFMANHLATTPTLTDSAETEETEEEQGDMEIAEIIFSLVAGVFCCACFGWCCSVCIKRNNELMEIEKLAKKLKDSENLPDAELRVVIGEVQAELEAQPPRSYIPPASKKLKDSETLPGAELRSAVREVWTELQAQTRREREANKAGHVA